MIGAITRLHYGAPYLDACIRSSEGFAEKHIVIYTEQPNFPGSPSMPCPDTREQLFQIARTAGGERLVWIDHPEPGVGIALDLYPQIRMAMELDSDEILHQDLGTDIKRRFEAGELTAKRYRLPMIHHWRAFRYGCTDGQWPVRLYLPYAERNDVDWYPHTEPKRYIHHMGYAIPRAHMEYKWMLSLHKNEMRPEWWGEIYDRFPERLTDLHPVSNNGFWNAEEIPDGELPAAFINHPYRYLEVVE